MNDLISRSKLKEEAESLRVIVTGLRSGKGILTEYAKHYRESFLKIIDDQQTVEAKPVVRGEWIEFDIDYGGIPTVGYQCSECGQSNGFITDFCPNCGADMRGEKND